MNIDENSSEMDLCVICGEETNEPQDKNVAFISNWLNTKCGISLEVSRVNTQACIDDNPRIWCKDDVVSRYSGSRSRLIAVGHNPSIEGAGV